jgi:hypothetical protein
MINCEAVSWAGRSPASDHLQIYMRKQALRPLVQQFHVQAGGAHLYLRWVNGLLFRRGPI